MNLEIDITVETERWTAIGDIGPLARRAIETAWRESGDAIMAEAEISIVLCDDAFIAGLNEKWRGKAKPTNVLSFPIDADLDLPALGDIVIAYETVAREAEADGKTLTDHLTHMIIHGFLHLIGFDHEDDGEAEAMEALETRVLARLGIASPYDQPPPGLVSRTAEGRRSAP